MNIKRISAIITSAVLLLNQAAFVSANASDDKKLNITFNDLPTNTTAVAGITLSGGSASVKNSGGNNKALLLTKTDTTTTVIAEGVSNPDGNVVYSVDIKQDETPVNLTLSTAPASNSADSAKSKIITVSDNKIVLNDNKVLGTVKKGKFTSVSAVIKKSKICDIYIDNTLVYENYKLTVLSNGAYVFISQLSDNSCYIDNIRAYKGNKPDKNMSVASYNKATVENISAEDYAGDYCFFDNRYCYTSGAPKYGSFELAQKTNQIVCTRLIDYQSPDRTDYIYMNRTDTENDCFFNINVKVGAGTNNPTKRYRYYKFEGDFKSDKIGSPMQLPLLRDTVTSSSAINSYPCKVDTNGNMTFADNTVVKNVFKPGEWFHYLLFIDLDMLYCDAYINGKLVASQIPLNSEMKQINLVRVLLDYGTTGDLYVDNFDFTGLAKPIVNGVETKTSVFPEGESVKKFLSGKTAMHTYGHNLYKDDTKSELEKGIYEKYEEEYYVPVSSINSAFDLALSEENGEINGDYNITADGTVTDKENKTFKLEKLPKVENGKMYIPVREFAQSVLGKFVWFFKTGIIIFTDEEFYLDTSDWVYQSQRVVNQTTVWNDIDHLNNFLQYVRPDSERLKADYIKTTGDTEFKQHPRLYLNEEKFAEMKKHYEAKDDEVYNKITDEAIKKADSYLDKPPVGYEWDDPMRTLNAISNNLLNRFIYMGYAYNLTGDKKYVDKAYEQFEKCATYPDFNTSHIIDTGDDCLALAIGFDWFYNGFTPEQREVAKRVLHDTALKTLASGLYGRLTSTSSGTSMWYAFKWMSNYNSIINGGVTAAAIATLEYDTDETFQYLSDSIKSVEYSLQMLTPDGGWNEAVTYWEYAMRYIMFMGAALEGCFGQSYDIMNGQGMENTLNYVISCLGVDGTNNYGDSHVGKAHREYSSRSFLGLAGIYNHPIAYGMRKSEILKGSVTPDYCDAIFYDFDMPSATEELYASMPNLLRTNGTEIVSIRDTYDFEKSQSYFSAHFGTTSGYHQHCDCGTFVLDLMGTRWAEDLGRDEYNLQNVLGYKDKDIYRKRAEGHNVLVLNPANYYDSFEMKNDQFAPIIDAQSNEYSGFVAANLDDVYNEASKMKLGYFMDENLNSLTVRNEFTVAEDTEALWSFITMADITIEDNIAYLYKDGKSVKLEFISTDKNAKWEEMEAKPLPTSPQTPEQTKNGGFKKVVLKFNASSGDNYFVVKVSPVGVPTKPIWDAPIDEWKLTEKFESGDPSETSFKMYYNGETFSGALPVYDGVMPKIDVITENPKAIVEINEAKNVLGKTSVKVWNEDKTYFQLASVKYYRASKKTMDMFNQLGAVGVSVSSQPEPQNKKENVLDNDFTTRWTGMAHGEYAVIDLGEVKKIDGVALAFWKGYEREYYFDIYVSEDGEKWTEAYLMGQSSGTTENLEAYAFDSPLNAQYVKCVGFGNSVPSVSNVNINMLEFRALTAK